MILLHVALLVFALWVFSRIMPMILNAPAVALGFATGTIIGIVFGSFIHNIVQSLAGMINGFRAERLLLALLDAIDSEASEEQPGLDSGIESDGSPEDFNRA